VAAARSPVRAEIAAFLEAQRALGAPAVWDVSLADARAGMVASSRDRWGPVDDLDDLHVEDVTAPGRHGEIGLRVYRALVPDESQPTVGAASPAFVYVHGGGWVVGDLESHDGLCRALAAACGCTVIAVDYRRAPEHPFPMPLHDAVDATAWVVGPGASALGIDPSRVVVGGDSAGGNLATVVAQHLARAGTVLSGQVLIYPACDVSTSWPSFRDFAEGYDLTTAMVEWFYGQYAGTEHADDPDRAPMRAAEYADVPAYVATAEYDPVRDDGRRYAARLVEHGVAVDFEEWPGVIHGFALMRTVTPATDELIDHVAEFCRRRWRSTGQA
jgi:acetyl esterase